MMKNKTINYYHANRIPINWDELTINQRNKLIDHTVKNGYTRIISLNKKDILDSFTASAIMQIKDALSQEAKEKYLSCNLYKVVDLTWKLVEKSKET